MEKRYTISLGGVSHEGQVTQSDAMLFPADMNVEERDALIKEVLEAQDEDEQESTD
jgi:hypothetical protein